MNQTTERHKVYTRKSPGFPHCNVCHEMLHGDGSGYRPYSCLCGEWRYTFVSGGYHIANLLEGEKK